MVARLALVAPAVRVDHADQADRANPADHVAHVAPADRVAHAAPAALVDHVGLAVDRRHAVRAHLAVRADLVVPAVAPAVRV